MTAVYIKSNLNNQKRQVFSLIATVAAMVRERGVASVDHLLPDLPGFTRQQVMAALINARTTGLLETCGKSEMTRRGKKPALYRACTTPRPNGKVKKPRLVSSVFELGNPKPESAWPQTAGTVYRPLGAWNSEQEAA